MAIGILRYLFLIHRRGLGEDPAATLLLDGVLLAVGLAWLVVNAILIAGMS